MSMRWREIQEIPAHKFTCGYCDSVVSSDRGYEGKNSKTGAAGHIRICPHCVRPSFFLGALQIPGVMPGNEVGQLPKDIEALYLEARGAISVDCFTASVLICRKLLMNIAVSLTAAPGKSFVEYVDFLANKNYVPPNGRGWVDHIRKKGNEATHEIALMSKADAMDLIAFSEMLLKFIYEFPAKVPTPNP